MVWALGLCLFGLAPTISIPSCCEGMGGGTEHLGFLLIEIGCTFTSALNDTSEVRHLCCRAYAG